MRREGSPLTGVSTVMLKEAADHMTSARMHLVMLLVLLTAMGAIYGAISQIRDTIGEDPFLFLKLFTVAQEPLPSFASFLGFLLPLTAIALGFDAVNGEYNRHTMSRILAQPIYRDALLFGKFLAGLLVLAIALVVLWLLTMGLGILFLGLPPSGEEVVRALLYLLGTIAYGGVWLALAMTFSVLFRSPATSALAALSVWLVLSVFWTMIAPLVAQGLVPIDPLDPMTLVRQFELEKGIERLSPATLYGEITVALLNPATRTLGTIFLSQLQGMVTGAPLPVLQSVLICWPQITGLLAAMLVLFTIAYVSFQRQEVRA